MSGYSMSAEIKGLDQMVQAFKKAPRVVIDELSGALLDAGASVQSRAVRYAPHRYGPLQGSIHTEGPQVTQNNVVVRVGTNLEYAKWQEFGTGIYGPRGTPIRPKRAKILFFKVGGQKVFAKSVKGVRPKLFFKRAREEAQPILERNIKQAVNNIINFLARG